VWSFLENYDDVMDREKHENITPIPRTYYNKSKIQGTGHPKRTIFSSAALTVILLFYPLSMASFFNPDVYKFVDRTTYHQLFESTYYFNQLVDNIVIILSLLVWVLVSMKPNFRWLIPFLLVVPLTIGLLFTSIDIFQLLSMASLPLIISFYMLNNKISNHNILYKDSGKSTLNYLSMSITFLAVFSIFLSTFDFDIINPFMNMNILFTRYSHIILLLIIFSLFVRITAREILLVLPYKISTAILKIMKPFDIPNYGISRKSIIGLLSFSVIVSLIVVLIPHLGQDDHKIAVDTSLYEDWISPMREAENIGDIIRIAFLESPTGSEGDRPISLLILYLISSVSNSIYGFEIILPAVLAPVLVLCIYFLTKELTNSALVAIFSSFVTAVSFQVMIGMYAGFYANWIALVFGYSSLLFSLRFLNTRNHRYLIGMSVFMVLLLLSHTYTWTIITIFYILFLVVLRWKKVYEPRAIVIVMVIVICVIVIDLSKSYSIGLTSGFQHDIGIAQSNKLELFDRWGTIVGTVQVHLGGIFSNTIILILALYTAIFLNCKNVAYLFIMVFLAVCILPLFFGDRVVQSRVLYDIPFQIPAGIALSNLLISRNGRLRSIAFSVCIFAISFYTMSNLSVAPS
jgi:hypothetical protein